MSIQKKFETILATNDFTQLAPYTEPASWNLMTQDERELLGILFVKQGEHQLMNGDSRVLESFDVASKVAPHSPVVFFKQALAFASQEQNIRCLTAASKALEKATELEPSFIHAWFGWGNILVNIGSFYNDAAYYYQADAKFAEVERLSQIHLSNLPDGFFWYWGVCWYKLGRLSGEAIDFFNALEKFRLAAAQGSANGKFCNDFGNVLVEIAFLLGREELFEEAAEQYKIAVAQFPAQYEGWVNLGCAYQRLHEIHGTEEYFQEADKCFECSIGINSNDYNPWLRWAELYANAGKFNRDLERIQASFDKFERANACDHDNAVVLSRWGEAQMLAASYTEDLELLRDAETKIALALEISPETPAIWYIYGTCLCELGRYFEDVDYFQQAIVNFENGLSLNDSHTLLHHGMALAHFAIGEMTGNPIMLEKAISNFDRTAELNPHSPPSFWNDWGVALMKLGELTNERKYVEAAAEKFERAISNKIEGALAEDVELEWLYNYGCAMDFLGDFHEEPVYYERAVQVLTHVLQIDPDYSHARYNLALALSHLGELNSDVECFHKAIDLFHALLQQDTEDEMAWNDWGLTLLNLAFLTSDISQVEYCQKLYDDAENKFLHAVALGNIHAFYNLACLYALTNNPTAAMHYLERAEISIALPSVEDIIHDEWLENLRSLPAFRSFISQLLGKQQKDK